MTRLPWSDQRIAALEAEVARLRKAIAFWAGEGQEDRPELIEWRELAANQARTPEQDRRMGEISEQIMRENQTAPELRQRIAELEAKVARLRAYAIGDARCPCCEEIYQCPDACTFAADAPEEAERMRWARDALRPEDIAGEAKE